MATLTSPGVSITTTDESFYTPASQGTVPLLIIATKQDKSNPDGSGTASFTTAAEAGKLKLITSQRELLQSYGDPLFYSSGGSQQHGSAINEYGLLAAHSFLGISSRAYILRADIDLGDLAGSVNAPTVSPTNGAIWLDTPNTKFGIKQYNSTTSKWDVASYTVLSKDQIASSGAPKASVLQNGSLAVVTMTSAGAASSLIKFYLKYSDTWYQLTTNETSFKDVVSKDFQMASFASLPTTQNSGGALANGDLLFQYDTLNNGSNIAVKVYNSSTGAFSLVNPEVWSSTHNYFTTNGNSVASGTYIANRNQDGDDDPVLAGELEILRHNGSSTLVVQGSNALTDTAISLASHTGSTVSVIVNDSRTSSSNINVQFRTDSDADGNASVDDMIQDFNSAFSTASSDIVASNVGGKVTLTSSTGRDIRVRAGNVGGFGPTNLNITAGIYSNWKNPASDTTLTYSADANAPTGTLTDGKLWYDTSSNVDILYNKPSVGWTSYSTDYDVNVTASEPTKKADGVSSLVNGDLWVDSDAVDQPAIYKWNSSTSAWVKVDNTDQVTGDGIIFKDMRQSPTSSLDADATQASTKAVGILAWNTRYSGKNVKEYKIDYTPAGTNVGDVWVTASGNKNDGSMYSGNDAVRRVVETKMASELSGDQDIRSETNFFNVISAPGFPGLLDEMITLNTDKKEVAFILADAPFTLDSSSLSLQNWATNANSAGENGKEGLVSSSAYAAVHYPHGLTTNLDGTNVVVPASHIALRTLAYNDQVAYQWFAPAGFNRGLVQNATSVGYVAEATSEFQVVNLSEGQRDTLYANKINPIGNFPGQGLAVFGQKTLNPSSSALDRINVARLINYIRYQLDIGVKPFLFEPNDSITRQGVKRVADNLLSELVSLRGVFDFITVCDETNNTTARINRNELYLDVAIQPTKAVEFIYVPIRIQSTLGQTGS